MFGTSSRAVRRVIIIVAVGVIGAASVVIAGRIVGSDQVDQSGYAPPLTLGGVTSGNPVDLAPGDSTSTPAAPTALEAVRRYLDGEISGDFEQSFGQLSVADRIAIGSVDDWEISAENRPTYTGYRIVTADADQIIAEVDIVPGVNETKGVRPSQATVSFALAHEDGGIRVAWADTTMTPHYPDVQLASPAAAAWVDAAQRCDVETRAALEYDGNLLGGLGLTESLCGLAGDVTVERSGKLDSLSDPSFVLSAFGEPSADWSRVVRVGGLTGSPAIDVVLAPLGERWVVIGGVVGT